MSRLISNFFDFGTAAAVDSLPLDRTRLLPPSGEANIVIAEFITTGTATIQPVYADPATGTQYQDDSQAYAIAGAGNWRHQFDGQSSSPIGLAVTALEADQTVAMRAALAKSW